MEDSKMLELKSLLKQYPNLTDEQYTKLAELLDEKMGYDD
jgi:hypothetical protein